MKKLYAPLGSLIGLALSIGSFAQTSCYQNASLEGPQQPHVVPSPWQACYGSPDTQPGNWGITQAPSNGNSYVSFLHSGWSNNGYNEGMTQLLTPCMQAGTTYQFTVDLAHTPVYTTADPNGCYSSLAVFGGSTACAQQETLWVSGAFTHTNWQQYTITFTPTGNWCYLSFSPYFISQCGSTGWDYINVMMDNISCVQPANPGIQITSPTASDSMPCGFLVTGTTDSIPLSVTLTGSFIGSPINATVNGTNWYANVSYPQGMSGNTTIWANAVFDSSTAMDSVIFHLIDIVPAFNAPDVCIGSPTYFTDQSTITFGSIASWQWDFGDGNTSTQQHPSHTYANPGVYTVQLVVTSDSSCTDTIVQSVNVHSLPVAAFVSNNVCLGQTTNFNSTSSTSTDGAITGWAWNFDEPSSGANNISNQQNPSHTYATAGTYNVLLIVTTQYGCTDSVTLQTTVHSNPVIAFSADTLQGCGPLCVNFTDQSTVANSTVTQWAWTFGDGNSNNLTGTPQNCYNQSGLFTVTLSATSAFGCTSVDSVVNMINVYPFPVAGFVMSPQPTTISNPIIHFTDQSINTQTWEWDFGDPNDANNNTSNIPSPIHTYSDSGVYCVRLIVNNGFCTDTLTQCLVIDPELAFYIPNTFTPNGDGKNDIFMPKGVYVEEFEMMIFDRWGNMIFKSNDLYKGWDGKVQGHTDISQNDTYVYVILVKDSNEKKHRYIGHINLTK